MSNNFQWNQIKKICTTVTLYECRSATSNLSIFVTNVDKCLSLHPCHLIPMSQFIRSFMMASVTVAWSVQIQIRLNICTGWTRSTLQQYSIMNTWVLFTTGKTGSHVLFTCSKIFVGPHYCWLLSMQKQPIYGPAGQQYGTQALRSMDPLGRFSANFSKADNFMFTFQYMRSFWKRSALQQAVICSSNANSFLFKYTPYP